MSMCLNACYNFWISASRILFAICLSFEENFHSVNIVNDR